MFDHDLIYTLGYWFAFLVSAAFGNPIPEEVMIASAGVHAASMGEYGSVSLAAPADGAGRRAGRRHPALRPRPGVRRAPAGNELDEALSPPEKRDRIHENFHRYGFVIFAIGRLVPGIRTTLFLTAGTMRLSLLRFCLADGVGALVGGSLFFFLGYGLGNQFEELLEGWENQLASYKPLFFVVLLGLVAAYLLYTFLRRPIPTGDPEEVPLIGHQIAVHIPDKERQGADPATDASPTSPTPEVKN